MAIPTWFTADFAIRNSKHMEIIIQLNNWENFASFQVDEPCPKKHSPFNKLCYFYYYSVKFWPFCSSLTSFDPSYGSSFQDLDTPSHCFFSPLSELVQGGYGIFLGEETTIEIHSVGYITSLPLPRGRFKRGTDKSILERAFCLKFVII